MRLRYHASRKGNSPLFDNHYHRGGACAKSVHGNRTLLVTGCETCTRDKISGQKPWVLGRVQSRTSPYLVEIDHPIWVMT